MRLRNIMPGYNNQAYAAVTELQFDRALIRRLRTASGTRENKHPVSLLGFLDTKTGNAIADYIHALAHANLEYIFLRYCAPYTKIVHVIW